MKMNNFKRISAISTIMLILLLLPVIASASTVPWISETYTAYACASTDSPAGSEEGCYGSFESYVYGPPLPISNSETTQYSGGNSSITNSDMTVYSHQGWADERAVGMAEFSGTYIATSEYYFLFTYELSGNSDAWLTVTDETSGTILGDYTLQQTSSPLKIGIYTTHDHLIAVDFGIEAINGYGRSGTLSYSTAVAPEPISSTLFIVGGATLGFRRFRKKFKI